MLRRFSDVAIGSLEKLLNNINGITNENEIKGKKKRKVFDKIDSYSDDSDNVGFIFVINVRFLTVYRQLNLNCKKYFDSSFILFLNLEGNVKESGT